MKPLTGEELFDIWTPASSRWSPWAKPVLFAYMDYREVVVAKNHVPAVDLPTQPSQEAPFQANAAIDDEVLWQIADTQWFSHETIAPDAAIVVDLPDIQSIICALVLARAGYQPVPLYNCSASYEYEEVIPTRRISAGLIRGAMALQSLAISPDARPAFILDANRLQTSDVAPGKYDNRWMIFPQDFPSARYLRESGIRQVIIIQAPPVSTPASTPTPSPLRTPDDLWEVCRLWQEGGLSVYIQNVSPLSGEPPGPPHPAPAVQSPHFRWIFQRALAAIGLRPSAAAGFGSLIPDPVDPSYGGGG